MEKHLPNVETGKPHSSAQKDNQALVASLHKTIHNAMHDLKSPLNVVKPYVDFLRRVDDPEKQKAILDRMKTAVEKMEVVINRFVKYTDLICKATPETESIVFRDIVEKVCKEMDQQYPGIQREIEIRNEPKGINFTYPPQYLNSILKILLDNAFKYRNPKRVLKIKISVSMIRNDLLLEMKDNGTGFPEYFSIEEAFIPFAKNPNPTKGIGLGLASLKYMVEKNKGEVYGSSSEDGTAFIIKLKPYPVVNNLDKDSPDRLTKNIGPKDRSNVVRVS